MVIRVLIVCNEYLRVAAVKSLLSRETDISLMASKGGIDLVIKEVVKDRPNVVIVDESAIIGGSIELCELPDHIPNSLVMLVDAKESFYACMRKQKCVLSAQPI